jgi:hypothetical protein
MHLFGLHLSYNMSYCKGYKIRSSNKLNSSSGNSDEESKEPDYDEDQDQLEEDQEEETGETSEATINQVFFRLNY